jgi:energy-converting hydrogenase Eha subunit C
MPRPLFVCAHATMLATRVPCQELLDCAAVLEGAGGVLLGCDPVARIVGVAVAAVAVVGVVGAR